MEDKYDFSMILENFFIWGMLQSLDAGDIHQVTSPIMNICFMTKAYGIISYVEEMRFLKVLNEEQGENPYESTLEIEVLPLFRDVVNLYKTVYKERGLDKEELISRYFKAYVDRISHGAGEYQLQKIFEKDSKNSRKKNGIIDLEVKLKWHNCTRVLRLNLSNSLYDVHIGIQNAFEFDDDHLFAFYIGHGMMKVAYTLQEALSLSDDEKSVEDTTLGELEFRSGFKFSYLFDFGDNWWFDIKVLNLGEGTVQRPCVIKSVNEPPCQYSNYEEY